MNSHLTSVPRLARRLALLLAASLTVPAVAGPGHEGGHDHDEAPVLGSGPALPRFEAHSDLFEAVGVVNGGELSLTLDTYTTNEPVPGARIELESGTFKALGEFRPEQGNYRFDAGPFVAPGSHPVTLTVTAGNDIDLLAADLIVPGEHPAAAEIGKIVPGSPLLWGAGGLVAGLALAFGLRRRRKTAA
ncbi:hypothetical protein [Aromatoleum diolicum]|uniref:Uncharacterized protein n=1 Tax=Aromatoleum diolicum TaxID=75796 RepID=A0ABX1QCF8_9RHOO|nr:hypothetical protein [Aromatoleum diolicum]NMG75177.1 hypothetical protein [Aromatoleum diolicum]